MFELALAAKLPIIGVSTDDPANFLTVLKHLSGYPVEKHVKGYSFSKDYLYYSTDADVATPETYQKILKEGASLVIINPEGANPLIFDAGVLPTPELMVKKLITEMVGHDHIAELFPVLRGLSLRVSREVLMLTAARTQGQLPSIEVRRTRASLFGTAQGLYAEDTSFDFYIWPEELKAWLQLNAEYFHKPTHAKLVPRGVLMEGPPGVGKSMGSKAIANTLGVPLYRFDIASTLDKYIGVAEARVAKILGLVDREAPCILLLDEVEKIFKTDTDNSVIQRLLSQLLWWLAEHQSRVITVMTTNDKSAIPPELYRQGRIDLVLKLSKLNTIDSRLFAQRVFESVVGKQADMNQLKTLYDNLQSNAGLRSHAEVAETVYTLIKRNKWM